MKEADFIDKCKELKLTDVQIETLINLAYFQAKKGIFSLSWYFMDVIDMLKTKGYTYTLEMLGGKSQE